MKLAVNIKTLISKLIKNMFSIYTYQVLVFVLVMLMMKITQIMYKIKDFNYLYCVFLFCLGLIKHNHRRRVLVFDPQPAL